MFENLAADLNRLSPGGRASLRTLIAGLLSQGFQAILVYRLFRWIKGRGLPGQPFRFLCERLVEMTTGISIPVACRIGKGLRIHHFGGIILHPTVELGEECTLYQGVTIGDRGGFGRAARIGNNVLIGAGAKVIGEIVIGDDCIIGANAVVTKDMPRGTVAVGSPCRFKERDDIPPARKAAVPAPPPRVMDLRGTYKGGGGPDKTILNSAAQHDPERVHVLVAYLRQPDDREFQIPEMARKLGIEYVDFADRGMIDRHCLTGLKRLIAEHRLQVVHTHDDKTLLYGWLLKLMVPRLRIMYTCHSHAALARSEFGSSSAYLRFRLRQKVRIFLMGRYLKPVLAVSHDTKRRLVADGLPERDIAVLTNGIDLRVWQREGARPAVRDEIALAPGTFLVGTVARITADKDLPTFYEVARLVTDRIPSVVFAIAGDGYGDELARAREEVARQGLDRKVIFLGHRTDLRDVYVSFDLFLMTSRTEGMPNTLLEAMALGVAPVSTAVGGIPELVEDGRSGFLAPAGDARALADHVIRLLRDDILRQRVAQGSRERVAGQFSFSRRVSLLEDYYQLFAGLKAGVGDGGGRG